MLENWQWLVRLPTKYYDPKIAAHLGNIAEQLQ